MPIDLPSKSRAVVISFHTAPLALLINARKLLGSRSPYRMLRLSLFAVYAVRIDRFDLSVVNFSYFHLRDYSLAVHLISWISVCSSSHKYIKVKTINIVKSKKREERRVVSIPKPKRIDKEKYIKLKEITSIHLNCQSLVNQR